MKPWFKIYLLWAVLVFILVFSKQGFSADNITHGLIALYFGLTLLYIKIRSPRISAEKSKNFFIYFCVFSAAIVEGCYMITRPVFESVLITPGMSASQIIGNYSIDLLFTIPAYFVIFRVLWFIINKYKYSTQAFAILMAFGQALGDGSRTFLTSPGLLLFIPYIMINYHAMNVAPYISVKDTLQPTSASQSKFKKIILPLILLPFTYLACGLVIYTVGAFFHLH